MARGWKSGKGSGSVFLTWGSLCFVVKGWGNDGKIWLLDGYTPLTPNPLYVPMYEFIDQTFMTRICEMCYLRHLVKDVILCSLQSFMITGLVDNGITISNCSN